MVRTMFLAWGRARAKALRRERAWSLKCQVVNLSAGAFGPTFLIVVAAVTSLCLPIPSCFKEPRGQGGDRQHRSGQVMQDSSPDKGIGCCGKPSACRFSIREQ